MSYNSLLGLGSHSVDANLEAHWPCQESSGLTVADRSGNSRDATFSGEATNLNTTTGPNSYLTSAIAGDGTDDLVTMPATAIITGANARTYCFFAYAGAGVTGRAFDVGESDGSLSGRGFFVSRSGTGADRFYVGLNQHSIGCADNSWPDDTWLHLAVRVPDSSTSTSDVELLINGVEQSTATVFGSSQTLNTLADTRTFLGGDNNVSNVYMAVDMAEVASFSRALSDAEVLEIASGPEPECTTAPTVSGDTAQGATLTCSPGTWALPAPFASGSNGTITYTYQWTRDGSNISGATSSTYVTQAADVGTAVGCKVLGANDGGSDSAEETASSNTISVVASGTTYRLNMTLSISNGISL